MIALLPTIGDTPILPTLPWDAADDAAGRLAGPFQHVGIGELKIGGRGGQLKALLGSCVGIAFLWKKRGRCGLAHCLLPETAEPQWEPGARYVSQAVPSLLRLMGTSAADYADIEVVVTGGGMMLSACSSRFQIGQQNADAARKYLELYGLNVVECRVGGKSGRTLAVDCATCSYQIEDITAQPMERRHAHA
jgi:chemotaxis protein CheD